MRKVDTIGAFRIEILVFWAFRICVTLLRQLLAYGDNLKNKHLNRDFLSFSINNKPCLRRVRFDKKLIINWKCQNATLLHKNYWNKQMFFGIKLDQNLIFQGFISLKPI